MASGACWGPLLRQQAGSWQFHNDENKIEGPLLCFLFDEDKPRNYSRASKEGQNRGSLAITDRASSLLAQYCQVRGARARSGRHLPWPWKCSVVEVVRSWSKCSAVDVVRSCSKCLLLVESGRFQFSNTQALVPLRRLTRREQSGATSKRRGAGKGRLHASG